MVREEREVQREYSKPLNKTNWNYCYINGELHRKLHINRPHDIITMWCYPRNKRVTYSYADVKSRRQPAFTSTEVAKMVMRHWCILERAILAGEIEPPQATVGEPGHNRKRYMWSEDDIMALHEVLLTKHSGWPRVDGRIIPKAMPTRAELRAIIRNNPILYVKTDDGKFVPTWQAEYY